MTHHKQVLSNRSQNMGKDRVFTHCALPFLMTCCSCLLIVYTQSLNLTISNNFCPPSSNSTCGHLRRSKIAGVTSYASITGGFSSLIVVGSLGAVSDRFGRRSVFAWTMISFLMANALYYIAFSMQLQGWENFIYIGQVLYG